MGFLLAPDAFFSKQQGHDGDPVEILRHIIVRPAQFGERRQHIRKIGLMISHLTGLDRPRPIGDKRDAETAFVKTHLLPP